MFSRPDIIQPGDSRYDLVRQVWNGKIDRRPAEIVRCADVADVVWSLQHAQEKGLPVAIRSGGHSVAGHCSIDNGLVLDLRAMQKLKVDVEHRTATVEPGVTWGLFDATTQEHALATTGGSISSVGIAGSVQCWGVGRLLRRHGLIADNLIGAQIVLASGEVLTTSLGENTDLFWGIRGGAGNFGVLTRMTFQLHCLQSVYAGLLIYDIEDAINVLRDVQAMLYDVQGSVVHHAVFAIAPPIEPFPVNVWGKPVLLLNLAFFDMLEDETASYLKKLRSIERPLVDAFNYIKYRELQRSTDGTAPAGKKWFQEGEWLEDMNDEAVATIIDAMHKAASPYAQIILQHVGGAMNSVDPLVTSFRFREVAHYFVEIINAAEASDVDAMPQQHWAQRTWEALLPYSVAKRVGSQTAPHLSHLDQGAVARRVQDAFRPEDWKRMVGLKQTYDPKNIFCHNPNISSKEM